MATHKPALRRREPSVAAGERRSLHYSTWGLISAGLLCRCLSLSSRHAASHGGAIESFGTLTLSNSVVDGDCTSGGGPGASIVSRGYNIESEGDTRGFDQPTDQVNVVADNLALGPLQDNGGPTETHALGEGSVAIDVAQEAECQIETDQRGLPRDSTCDVGAFEVQAP